MRHNVYGKHLSRSKNERSALFKNLVRSLLLSEKIETTQAKAKAVKGLVDKIITQAKSSNGKYLLSKTISDKSVSEKLLTVLVPRLSDRVSGYTSTVALGRRLGDGAMVVQMRLLLSDEVKAKSKPKEEAETVKVEKKVEVKKVAKKK